ncbi:MAG: hypothetical protein NTX22_13930 [Ignavibacteriales bacterium]|nr:hypothetical protein [Ignavibacteriales bacterium]
MMARIKNIEAQCSVCGNVTKMELAGEIPVFDNPNKRWAKCKKCKQMVIVDITANEHTKVNTDDISLENFSEYSPAKTFVLGESIYHKTWDDYGMVIAKEISSNGQNSIKVEFIKVGQKKLIESVL